MEFIDEDGNKKSFEDIMQDCIDQPHTIGGERGQQEMTLKGIQISECFLRGMLDAATHYAEDNDYKIKTEVLNWGHLNDLIFKVRWRDDFDPVAIVQCAACHLEKVLGIFPNVPKLSPTRSEE